MTYAQPHVVWLDRQPSHPNGYPRFMSEGSIEWLETKVAEYLSRCETQGYHPPLWQIAKHWTDEPDRPEELRFALFDAIHGVTHRALLAVAEQQWILKTA